MMAEDTYGGITFNWELKAAAAFCLIRWGEAGLNALVEIGRRSRTSKNHSLVLEILAALAAGTLPVLAGSLQDARVSTHLQSAVPNVATLAACARAKLQEYLLSFDDDDDVCGVVGLRLMQNSIRGGSTPTLELFKALASRWLAVSQPVLAAFRGLLAARPDDEPAFQQFFELHPQLIEPSVAEVWSQPDLHGAKEPDFVIRRADGTYLVVEIETPAKLLITDSCQMSAVATHAVTQVFDYADFLVTRHLEISTHFPGFQVPDALVVVGMEGNLTPDQARALRLENRSRHNVRVVGFDWLLRRAEVLATNLIGQPIPIHHSRLV